MGILIGMDEAGYGPQLGPLVIAATAWRVDDEVSGVRCQVSGQGTSASASKKNSHSTRAKHAPSTSAATAVLNPQSAIGGSTALAAGNPKSERPDLYRLLRTIVCKKSSDSRMAVADSKVLYTPGAGLRQLERGLHAVLLAMKQDARCWSSFLASANADPDSHHSRTCWPKGHDCSLPVDATSDEIVRLEARFSRVCDSTGVKPLLIRARLVFPEQFNELVAHYGSKGAALSHITVGLLREVVDIVTSSPGSDSQPAPSIYTVCDKHGGRNFYTAILQHHFSEHWVAPVFESHAASHYEWGEPASRMRVVFQMNGERFFPTALASMTAKYFRELSMRAFNDFWRSHLPDLQPTAGYYRDAQRFKKDIAAKQRQLEIEDRVLWRER